MENRVDSRMTLKTTDFLFVLTLSHRDETFLFRPNFISLTVLIFPKNVNYRWKKWTQATKMYFSDFCLLHIYISGRTFFVFAKFPYLQRFSDFMGDKKRCYNKQTNNEQQQQRTPRMMRKSCQDSFRILGMIIRGRSNKFLRFSLNNIQLD